MPPAKKTTRKKVAAPRPVEATTHADTRVNIPTDAQRDFVADDERAPLPVSIPRYADDRDPSLDPQLIWNGKITQDADGLDVSTVPIYIQEKIEPRAIIENLRDTAAPGEDEPELVDARVEQHAARRRDHHDQHRGRHAMDEAKPRQANGQPVDCSLSAQARKHCCARLQCGFYRSLEAKLQYNNPEIGAHSDRFIGGGACLPHP